MSHGTATTAVEGLGKGGAIRRDGEIVTVPNAYKVEEIDFDGKKRTCATIPWGDVYTAYHTTGIENIEVFMAAPPSMVRFMKASRWLGSVLGSAPVQRFMKSRIPAGGPDEHARTTGETRLWGRAKNRAGKTVEAHMRTPEAYQLTAISALLIAEKVLAGNAKPGYATPGGVYGADLVMEIDGVTRK